MRKVEFYVPDEVFEQLKSVAAKDGFRSVAALVKDVCMSVAATPTVAATSETINLTDVLS